MELRGLRLKKGLGLYLYYFKNRRIGKDEMRSTVLQCCYERQREMHDTESFMTSYLFHTS